MPPYPDPYQAFEDLIGKLVQVPAGHDSGVSARIDHLERLIEQWRIDRHELDNGIRFEEFLTLDWFADEDRLHFATTARRVDRGTGTPQFRLQRKLLVFLLLHHREQTHILESIRSFVERIRPDLSVLDFKKTETGVIRCFTNTRFAANKLRNFGLLRFTKVEAFKTWVLSLPGVIVAARTVQDPGWRLPEMPDNWHGLDPFILDCACAVRDFPSLVDTLAGVCEPDAKIFKTFEKFLVEAQRLLARYWETLSNPELPNKKRGELGREYIDQLESTFGYEAFLEELSSCIQIEDLLRKADKASQNL